MRVHLLIVAHLSPQHKAGTSVHPSAQTGSSVECKRGTSQLFVEVSEPRMCLSGLSEKSSAQLTGFFGGGIPETCTYTCTYTGVSCLGTM